MTVGMDEQPSKIQGFNGLWARSSPDDVPPDHLTDCHNCTFPGKGEIGLRPPTTVQTHYTSGGNVISFFIGQVFGGAVLLSLRDNGNFFDDTHATLLGTAVGADDFYAINMFGRIYITFKTAGHAITGGASLFVYYWTGSVYRYTAAGGQGPVLAPTLNSQNVATPGVTVGVHQIAYAYVTDRGFVTPPSPLLAVTAPGGQNIIINLVASGLTGIVSKVILMSLANQTQLFFIPSGTIPDATLTFTINVADTSLITDASYLFNINGFPLGGSALAFYKGRLVVVGAQPIAVSPEPFDQAAKPDDILLSDVSNPESFNKVTGVIHIPQEYGSNTSNGAMNIRDVLYITKPNGTYSTQDNGSTPDTWAVSIVDSGIGAWAVGLSMFASSMSSQDVLDSCLVASKRGLMLFDGTYSNIPLTYKIEGLWNMIPADFFYSVQVAHDAWLKRIYISIPLQPIPLQVGFKNSFQVQGGVGVGNSNFTLLFGDYVEGLTPNAIKWSTWWLGNTTFGNVAAFLKIAVENFTLNYGAPQMIYQFAFCGLGTDIYKIIEPIGPLDTFLGSTQSIQQQITCSPQPPLPTGISFFLMLGMAITGIGTISIKLYGKTPVSPGTTIQGFNIASYTNQMLYRGINFTGETMFVRIICDIGAPGGVNGQFNLNLILLYLRKTWSCRPALTQTL